MQGLQRKGYQVSLEEGIQITAPDMAPEHLPERSWTRT